MGSGFAGPTQLTGASFYWNPAVVGLDPNDYIAALDLGIANVRLNYQRAPDPLTRNVPYEPASSNTWAGNPIFTLAGPLVHDYVQWVAGGYSPSGTSVNWPPDGSQRYNGSYGSVLSYMLGAGLVLTPDRVISVAALIGYTYGFLTLKESVDMASFVDAKLGPGAVDYEKPALEARMTILGHGGGPAAIFALQLRPIPGLTLAASMNLLTPLNLSGTLTLAGASGLHQTLPGWNLSPNGNVNINYKLPFELHFEIDAREGPWHFSPMFWWSDAHVTSTIVANVTQASSLLIAGQQISIKGTNDVWGAGARITRVIDSQWELAFRIDYHADSVPTATMSATNVDFTRWDFTGGARYHIDEHYAVTLTYLLMYCVPKLVTDSVFNPTTPSSSGLSMASTNGLYSGFANWLVLGFERT